MEVDILEAMEYVGIETIVIDEDTPPPNPYLPGTNIQYAWDATSLEYLKRCGRLDKFMRAGWRPKEPNIHLRWGGEYHRCLQDYEILMAQGSKHRDAVFDVIRALLHRIVDFDPDHKQKNRETLVRSVIWYLEKHQNDPAKTWIMSNGKPAVEIRFNFPLDFGPSEDQPYVLCGKIDKVVVFNGDLFIMDHKTTTTLGTFYFDQFTPHNQMSLYTLAGKVIFKAPIKGVIINACQPLVGGTNFERGIVYRTQEQLNEWLTDLTVWLSRQNDATHNDAACDKYGGCPFRPICTRSPQVRERFLKSNYIQDTPWNPLMPRDSD